MLKSTANDDYIESNEQLDKCVKFDVREDFTVGVKIAMTSVGCPFSPVQFLITAKALTPSRMTLR